jgi:hypothetical protein
MNSGSDILSSILLRLASLADLFLGYAVSGNTLTDPNGVQLVSALATIMQNMATFSAQFSSLFANYVA